MQGKTRFSIFLSVESGYPVAQLMLSALRPLSRRRVWRTRVPRQERLGGLATVVADERGDCHPLWRGLPEVMSVVVEAVSARQDGGWRTGDDHRGIVPEQDAEGNRFVVGTILRQAAGRSGAVLPRRQPFHPRLPRERAWRRRRVGRDASHRSAIHHAHAA